MQRATTPSNIVRRNGYLSTFRVIIAAFSMALFSDTHAQESKLPDWRGVKLQAGKWSNPLAPSDWKEAKLAGYDWKAENVKIVNGGLHLTVNEKGSAQVIGQEASRADYTRWSIDVTLPTMKPGLVAAPLWTFNKKTNEEIDFEIVGTKGLNLTIWANVNGKHTAVWAKQVIAGDLSNQRLDLAFEYRPKQSVKFFVGGKEVASATPADTKTGHFPQGPMKPLFDLWAANGVDPGWAGKWKPLAQDEKLTMIIHGYKSE